MSLLQLAFEKSPNLRILRFFAKHTNDRKFLQLSANLDISELITPSHTKLL